MIARTRFLGAVAAVSQEPLAARAEQTAAGGDTTGRIVWECSNAMLRFLERPGGFARVLRASASASTSAPAAADDARGALGALHVIDLSAGAGLIALALAAAGAACVTATDTAAQLPLLRHNLASATDNARVRELLWGESVAPLFEGEEAGAGATTEPQPQAPPLQALLPPPPRPPPPPPPPGLCVCSDVLYIALRDGLARQLSWTLRALAQRVPVFFAFEERLISEESAFIESLREPLAALGGDELESGGRTIAGGGAPPPWRGAAPALSVEELPPADVRLDKGDALEREDGGELCPVDVFWEAPPLRAFVMRM
jgi:hypothetical protein